LKYELVPNAGLRNEI